MHRSASAPRRTVFVLCAAALSLLFAPRLPAQQTAWQPKEKAKIRAITAFINLDRATYPQQVSETLKFLKYAKTLFESRGYEVETIRISTQPFAQFIKGLSPEQARAFFKDYDALAAKEGFAASIGPAMFGADSPASEADLLAAILGNSKALNASIVVAANDGVRWPAVRAAARVMKKLSETTAHSRGNFNFSAIAMVPPLTPFYPGSYHTGIGHQFAIALQSANVVAEAFRDAPDLETAGRRLTESLGRQAFEIQSHAGRVDRETGWAYTGIDLSPAPLKDISIGAAIEYLTKQPVGSSGTLTAAAAITAALKKIGVKQAGYSGLMLPVLEDTRLAQRWSEGRISLDALLSYSAVCGTGLDTVPLPGDITEEQLSLIIGDMAALAFKWHKPLSARLLPVAGKAPGETTEFNDPFLVDAVLQPLSRDPIAAKP
jgi:uncharacterized protein (UPF0210 family)